MHQRGLGERERGKARPLSRPGAPSLLLLLLAAMRIADELAILRSIWASS